MGLKRRLKRLFQSLNGLTPDQRYYGIPRSPPVFNVKELKNAGLELRVSFLEGRQHLPIIELERAA